jgi:Tol biopolymer transport system component
MPSRTAADPAVTIRRRSILLLLALAMLGPPVGTASASGANTAGDAGSIHYLRSNPGEPTAIWAVRPDGSEDHLVVSIPSGSSGFAWSPDGSRIAFTRAVPEDGGVDYDIWVMKADGTQRMSLTTHRGSEYHPTWSPDGQWIAFSRHVRDDVSIFRTRAVAPFGLATRLTWGSTRRSVDVFDSSPAWSPTGDRIVFGRDHLSHISLEDSFTLGSVTPDGVFTRLGRHLGRPSWNPAGDRLAATNPGDCCNTSGPLFTLAPDGSDVVQIVAKDWEFFGPSFWAPDAERIVFSVWNGECDEWLMVPADGSAAPTPSPTACATVVAWR